MNIGNTQTEKQMELYILCIGGFYIVVVKLGVRGLGEECGNSNDKGAAGQREEMRTWRLFSQPRRYTYI